MRFKKFLIWFLIVAIAVGYNFAIRLPKDEKSQLVKITPKQESFKVSENPKFTLEIKRSKSLRRFFRLAFLPWPVAKAEEPVDFIEEVKINDVIASPAKQGEAIPSSDDVIASEPSGERGNPVADSENNEIAAAPLADEAEGENNEIAPPLQGGARNDTEVVTSTDFVIETPNPQVLGEFTPTSQTTTQTSIESVIASPDSTSGRGNPATSTEDEIAARPSDARNDNNTASTTDPSLLGQALEEISDLINEIQNAAQETFKAEPQVEVEVIDPQGKINNEVKVEIEKTENDQFEIALDPNGQKLARGDWEIEVQIQQGPLMETQRQSFNWGGREVTELRNYTSKTYNNLDGTYELEAHIGQIHYEDEQTGKLEDVDTTLIDQGDFWAMEKASYHAQIPKYANQSMVFQDVFEEKDQTITMISQTQEVPGEIENSDGWQNQRVRYKNAFGENIDLRVTVGNIGLFKEVIVNQKPENLKQDLTFDFEIKIPEGKSLYILDNQTQEKIKIMDINNLTVTGDQQLLIGDDNSFSRIQKIRVWDSEGNTTPGQLHFYLKDNKIYFQKIVPQEFLETATYPIYTDADATYYSGAGDGYVLSQNASWSTAQGAANGGLVDYTTANIQAPQSGTIASGAFVIRRGFWPIDTSALPAGATVTAATFSVYVTSKVNADNDGDDWINVVQTSQASQTALDVADFDTCGDAIDNPTEGATRIDIGNISTSAFNTWTLNATGRGWIKQSGQTSNCGTTAGWTCLGMREGHDALDHQYAGATGTTNRLNVYWSEQTGSGPYLSVTYTAISVSGTIYTNETGSQYNCASNNLTVSLKVNGAGTYSGTCTAADGSYTISSVVISAASDVITVWVDGEDSPSVKATTVTRAVNTSSNITGLDLYQNRLLVRHEDSGPTTNANLGQYDKDNDADIHFTSNSNALTVDNDTELHLWTGKTFSPGGTVTTSPGGTLGDVHIDDSATFTAGGAISVGGSWTADSSTTFTPGSYDVTFTATGTGKTITPASSSFYSLTFNGSGGGWTFQANATTTANFTITTGTVTGPSSGHIAVAGNWANNGGTFTPNSSEVKFNASAAGKTLSSSGTGNLTFYDVDFNSSTGGWTVQNNATSTHNWKLTSGAFAASSGAHIEVDSQFTNITSGTTTWTGSYLYLNSGSVYTINTKTTGADTYATLEIGANTDIRMWDSSASSYNVTSSGSLYSMDHAGTSGDLAIYGDYHIPSSSTDYWSYATDFDGTGSANRQVDVLLADGAMVNVDSGTTLQIIGTNTATTTATSTSVIGSYGFTLTNGTLNAQYYKFGRLNASGLNLTGASATITNLANGEFDNSAGAGASDTFITVAGDVITNNTAKTFSKCNFGNTNANANYNVTATGSTASYWTFSTSYGTFDGEANDSDPGGDPGYIRWDDSTSGTLSETASTSATFSSVTYSFTSQNDTGNKMGAVFISDSRGAAPGWDLNVTSADWSRTGGGSMDYNGNGSSTGQLCLVLSGAAIYAITGSLTGVTKGSDDCFDSGTSQIQIGDATVGNGVGTYWLVDVTMSQFIPAMQQAGTYTASLSIVAS